MNPEALAELGASVLSTDADVTAAYAHDESRLTGRSTPVAVLAPASTAEVAACLRVATREE